MDNIKKYWQLILIGLLIIGLAISIITRPSSDSVVEYQLQHKVDSLEVVIQTFPKIRSDINKQHQEDQQVYLDSIVVLNKLMVKQNKQIKNIDEKLKKRLNELSNLDSSGVSSYFSNRYK
jgi:hypothetical protein